MSPQWFSVIVNTQLRALAMDRLTSLDRSKMMAKVRAVDTKPERIVRSVAHRIGLRFRLHRRDLPGTPDLVFPRHKLVIFVHGCFWHRHEGCARSSLPSTNVEFWTCKFNRNMERDRVAIAALEAAGWRVAVIWECQTKDASTLTANLLSLVRRTERPL
ncbi:DNA mismatch endonuclease Vsr [Sphingobium sp. Sx8-8]|uniref:very short patch repair endonuclease n=1 Tax=Sphingobium sp. Sx8-8 TaxID=2933617 RepID=UPI001F55EF49|nr:DNA mismatch endonuclease Vsr [Sphingobium sp. Sx8-8]